MSLSCGHVICECNYCRQHNRNISRPLLLRPLCFYFWQSYAPGQYLPLIFPRFQLETLEIAVSQQMNGKTTFQQRQTRLVCYLRYCRLRSIYVGRHFQTVELSGR